MVRVRQYKRKDGTKVTSHKRTAPEHNLKFSKSDIGKIDFEKSLQNKVDKDPSLKDLISQAKRTHAKRSNRAQTEDESKSNNDTYKLSEKSVDKWSRHPGQHDLEGIDTPKKNKPSDNERFKQVKKEMDIVVRDMVRDHNTITRSDLQGVVQAQAMRIGKKHSLSQRQTDQIDNDMLKAIDKKIKALPKDPDKGKVKFYVNGKLKTTYSDYQGMEEVKETAKLLESENPGKIVRAKLDGKTLYKTTLSDAAKSNQSKGSTIKLKHITWHWNEGKDLGYDRKQFKSWQSFQNAINKVYESYIRSKSEGYDKVKVTITWEDGAYLIDRIDVGSSTGDYHQQRPIGIYMKASPPMYGSSLEQGSRDKYEWGSDVEIGKGKDNLIASSKPSDNKSDLKQQLRNFSGTQQYHYLSYTRRLRSTDGVKYLVDQTESYWMIDIIESYQPKLVKKGLDEFQIWVLKAKNNEGVIKMYEDLPGKAAITQKIPYTDFPLNEVKLFVRDGVLMLPSEN